MLNVMIAALECAKIVADVGLNTEGGFFNVTMFGPESGLLTKGPICIIGFSRILEQCA